MNRWFVQRRRFIVPIAILGFFVVSNIVCGEENTHKGLRINEVQVTGGSGKANHDFIEIYNGTGRDISVKGMTLRKIKDTSVKMSFSNSDSVVQISMSVLADGDYFVWVNNSDGIFLQDTNHDMSNGNTLPNTQGKEYTIGIFGIDKALIDSVDYKNIPEKSGSWSYSDEKEDWFWTTQVTPKDKNEFDKEEDDAIPTRKSGAGSGVRLNEILSNPEGKDTGKEFIELYNAGSVDVDISGWYLRDANLAKKSKEEWYVISSGKVLAGGFFVLYQSDFQFSLNASDEVVELLDPQGNVVDAMEYKTSKEGVSLNFDGSRWRAGRSLTPALPNDFNGEPSVQKDDVPKKAYKNTYAFFSAKAKDTDGDEVKYRWDFGDGHKSYKREAKHKYEEEGVYRVTLRVDDGREPVEKMYEVKVESYPKRKVRIIAFEPNPEGKDGEGEWVRVKNQDKKIVDMLGWSVVTGKDKKHLTNHPIGESVKIKKGKELTITRALAKISLNNTKGVIALRSPDGKTVQTVKYEKKGGIKEGEVYLKEKGKQWAWQETAVPEESSEGKKEEEEDTPEDVVEIWIDPVSEEIIGMTSGKEVAFFEGENFRQGRQLSRVLGARSVRLRLDGNRYAFTTARSGEHWAVVLWRQVKGMVREVL